MIFDIYSPDIVTEKAKALFKHERAKMRLDGWFIAKEKEMEQETAYEGINEEIKKAMLLKDVIATIPLDIDDNQIFAGTQDDAFARSYALINPSFKVEEFAGYCDPAAVFGDIEPNEEFTAERILKTKEKFMKTEYAEKLGKVYENCENHTKEVIYFIEQVTGHLIPDFRYALRHGVAQMIENMKGKEGDGYKAFIIALEGVCLLAERYEKIAREKAKNADSEEKKSQFTLMADTLKRVPYLPSENMYEAMQSFILLWQVMCLEQTPNPFAFSVGNADRIFEPYRAKENLGREETAALLKHLLVFFNVADRSWAISQNLIVSGKDENGRDLTNDTTYALLDAYYDMNLPQPILSVKLHKNTPKKLYEEMGRFFFSAGVLTPSLFNDESMFEVLTKAGVEKQDLKDYSIAGCQEPLIMGKDNGNTTNSWLNLGKILELTLNDGVSTITGKRIFPAGEPMSAEERLKNIRTLFAQNLKYSVKRMTEAANNATHAVSLLPVPFLSVMMGGIESGYDMRDIEHQGTKYNGSGCLIHGNSIVADSFEAIDKYLADCPNGAQRLLDAVKNNFEGDEELREQLLSYPKFGNNIAEVDDEAARLADLVANEVRAQKNNLGNHFRPDFSTPSTHLTYGYWVGALPNGRRAREMMNYGVDPLYGDAHEGMGFRTLSVFKLPFEKMCGGYASHFGVDPNYFRADSYEGKGIEFEKRVITPLFFNEANKNMSPFYLYVNVTTPEILRKVLDNPKKYAPSGVYIMRIHGTFVNFLDLSPALQQDIIRRLDLKSTAC